MNTSKIVSKKNIHIEVNKDLTLRVLSKGDITKKYINWLNQSNIMRFTEQNGKTHDQVSTEEFVHSCYLNEGTFLFGIFFNKVHIGNIKLGPINFTHQIADVSYVIGDRDYWGRGIATIVIKAVTNFGFNELNLHKINAGTYENNIGSIKALQKCGFNQEGLFIDEINFQGERINSLRFGLIKGFSN
jgi:RimJ/RimL family protein N-acetyltransferase